MGFFAENQHVHRFGIFWPDKSQKQRAPFPAHRFATTCGLCLDPLPPTQELGFLKPECGPTLAGLSLRCPFEPTPKKRENTLRKRIPPHSPATLDISIVASFVIQRGLCLGPGHFHVSLGSRKGVLGDGSSLLLRIQEQT